MLDSPIHDTRPPSRYSHTTVKVETINGFHNTHYPSLCSTLRIWGHSLRASTTTPGSLCCRDNSLLIVSDDNHETVAVTSRQSIHSFPILLSHPQSLDCSWKQDNLKEGTSDSLVEHFWHPPSPSFFHEFISLSTPRLFFYLLQTLHPLFLADHRSRKRHQRIWDRSDCMRPTTLTKMITKMLPTRVSQFRSVHYSVTDNHSAAKSSNTDNSALHMLKACNQRPKSICHRSNSQIQEREPKMQPVSSLNLYQPNTSTAQH